MLNQAIIDRIREAGWKSVESHERGELAFQKAGPIESLLLTAKVKDKTLYLGRLYHHDHHIERLQLNDDGNLSDPNCSVFSGMIG